MSMIKYKYENQLNLDFIIEDVIREFDLYRLKLYFDKLDVTYLLVSVSYFVKTDFKKVDKHFSEFGEMFFKLINAFPIQEYIDEEINLILGAFSKLLLNNLSFSQSVLFPNKDIQMIKSRLQVELLLEGKNFILIPNMLVKCTNIRFDFK
jgi:hypothetical protein